MAIASINGLVWRVLMVLVLAATLGLTPGGCASKVSDVDLEDEVATLKDVQKAADKPALGILLVDARSRAEWEAERIGQSTNLSLTQVSGREGEKDPRLAKFSQIIVFGENPGSATARAMAKKLMTTGYSNVKFFPGGMMEWKSANLPIRTGAPGEGMKER